MVFQKQNNIQATGDPFEAASSSSNLLECLNKIQICSSPTVSSTTPLSGSSDLSSDYTKCIAHFVTWPNEMQVQFVGALLEKMSILQRGQVDLILQPLLMRDFITDLGDLGLPHIAERILHHLDANGLRAAEDVNSSWFLTVQRGYLWKRLIEQEVARNPLWSRLARDLGIHCYLHLSRPKRLPSRSQSDFKSKSNLVDRAFKWPLEVSASSSLDNQPVRVQRPQFYRFAYPFMEKLAEQVESNWREGRVQVRSIQCHSEGSKGVYCIQYDDEKIVSGLRDNTIRVWSMCPPHACARVLHGHVGSVLCLQYEDDMLITGSSDSTVRVWSLSQWKCVHVVQHHDDAVLHLRFSRGILVTCSKDRKIAVWNLLSPVHISLRAILTGHRAAVNVVDFDDKYIVSASGDRTIKVWCLQTCELVRTLSAHKRGIACLQYVYPYIVSGSSDFSIRIWDVESGVCHRVLEGHRDLVRCIRFDHKRIISGAYDGEIKVWDFQAALHNAPSSSLCLQTLHQHQGRVFRLQFDETKIVSSSHDDTILIWNFDSPLQRYMALEQLEASMRSETHQENAMEMDLPPVEEMDKDSSHSLASL